MLSRMLTRATTAMLAVACILPDAANAQYYAPTPPRYRDGYVERDPGGDAPRRGRRDYRRYQHRCDRGTGGTILGAIAGGLLGNAVVGRSDRGVGTIVGAGAGALAGRAVDRDC